MAASPVAYLRADLAPELIMNSEKEGCDSDGAIINNRVLQQPGNKPGEAKLTTITLSEAEEMSVRIPPYKKRLIEKMANRKQHKG